MPGNLRSQYLLRFVACLLAASIVLPAGPAIAAEVARPSSRRVRLPPTENQHPVRPASAQDVLPAPHHAEHVEPRTGVSPPGCLTLANFENLALLNNPTLAQADSRIRAAQGQWVQAGLRPNPIVGYQGSELGEEGTAGQQGGFVSQEFVRRSKLELAQLREGRAVAVAQQDFFAQRMRVLNDVRAEYFNVLVAQRAVELTDELATIARQALQTTEGLYKGEQISYVEVLQSRVESHSAAISAEIAHNRLAAAWRRLTAVAGVPGLQPQHVTGNLDPPEVPLSFDQSLIRLLTESPQLASARMAVARARAAVERAEVEPLPNVDVQAGVQYDNSSQYSIANVQIGIPVPVLNRNQGNIQTAYADLRNAQAEVGRVELSLRAQLAQAYETYDNARHQVEEYTADILPDARQSLDLVRKGFAEQQFNFQTLLTSQRTFTQASLSYLQALQQLGTSRIAIEGLLLTGSLREEAAPAVPRVDTTIAPVFGPGRPPVERAR